jgi:hypothetical protein
MSPSRDSEIKQAAQIQCGTSRPAHPPSPLVLPLPLRPAAAAMSFWRQLELRPLRKSSPVRQARRYIGRVPACRRVADLMRRIRRNMNRLTAAHDLFHSAKRSIQLALEDHECLLEVIGDAAEARLRAECACQSGNSAPPYPRPATGSCTCPPPAQDGAATHPSPTAPPPVRVEDRHHG